MQCFCLEPQPHCHPDSRGCGDTIISSGAGTDAGGNKVLADVGAWASWAGYEPSFNSLWKRLPSGYLLHYI